MPKGMLHDITYCMGCRGCQVACKQWNDLPAESTVFTVDYTNPPHLSAKTWTIIEYNLFNDAGKLSWNFVQRKCLHCIDPACVSACPVGAITKTPEGPVIYDGGKCFGCRYCMIACPFGVPKFEWEKALPYITKCTFCFNRISDGKIPACAKACPTGAIKFGERDELLNEARERIRLRPDKYINHIYGEKEAGGTSVLWISPRSFEDLKFPEVHEKPYPALTWKALSKIPFIVIGGAVLLSGIWYITHRREEVKEAEKETKQPPTV